MTEDGSRGAALHHELASVQGAMMQTADCQQIFGRIVASFRAQVDVMQIEEGCVLAAGDAAAPLVASEHRSAQGGRDALFGAGVGCCPMLRSWKLRAHGGAFDPGSGLIRR